MSSRNAVTPSIPISSNTPRARVVIEKRGEQDARAQAVRRRMIARLAPALVGNKLYPASVLPHAIREGEPLDGRHKGRRELLSAGVGPVGERPSPTGEFFHVAVGDAIAGENVVPGWLELQPNGVVGYNCPERQNDAGLDASITINATYEGSSALGFTSGAWPHIALSERTVVPRLPWQQQVRTQRPTTGAVPPSLFLSQKPSWVRGEQRVWLEPKQEHQGSCHLGSAEICHVSEVAERERLHRSLRRQGLFELRPAGRANRAPGQGGLALAKEFQEGILAFLGDSKEGIAKGDPG